MAFQDCRLKGIDIHPVTGDLYLCGNRTIPGDTGGYLAAYDMNGAPKWQRTMFTPSGTYNFVLQNSSLSFIRFNEQFNMLFAGGSAMNLGYGNDDAISLTCGIADTSIHTSLNFGTGTEYFNDVFIGADSSLWWVGYTDTYTSSENVFLVQTDLETMTLCNNELMSALSWDFTSVPCYDPAFVMDTGNLDVITYCFPPDSLSWTFHDLCFSGTEELMPTVHSELQVMPNPNNGKFEIHFSRGAGDYYLQIINPAGEFVFEQQGRIDDDPTAGCTLPGSLSPGVYAIRIVTGEGCHAAIFILAE
jgi:hypothetical protein